MLWPPAAVPVDTWNGCIRSAQLRRRTAQAVLFDLALLAAVARVRRSATAGLLGGFDGRFAAQTNVFGDRPAAGPQFVGPAAQLSAQLTSFLGEFVGAFAGQLGQLIGPLAGFLSSCFQALYCAVSQFNTFLTDVFARFLSGSRRH